MWAISLLQAVRFTLRHTPEDKLKDTLGKLLDSLIKNKYLAVDRNGYTRYLTYTGKEYEPYFNLNTPLDRDVMRENMKKLDDETLYIHCNWIPILHVLQLFQSWINWNKCWWK